MTPNEKALLEALELDITTWEQQVQFFETSAPQVEIIGMDIMSGNEYARGLRKRIAEHRALIQSVKNS